MANEIEIMEYKTKSGKEFPAVSLAQLLEACGIDAPYGFGAITQENGDVAVLLWQQPKAEKKSVGGFQKPSPMAQAKAKGIAAKPLSTFKGQAPAPAPMAPVKPASPVNGGDIEARFAALEETNANIAKMLAQMLSTNPAQTKAAPVGTTITRRQKAG